jgi:hypothetical protein
LRRSFHGPVLYSAIASLPIAIGITQSGVIASATKQAKGRTLQGSVHCSATKTAFATIQPIWIDCRNQLVLNCDNIRVSGYFMKTFIADIIPKIQRYSKKLDDLTMLTNQHWVSIGDITQTKRVFIFRANNQLLISDNGIVEKGSWEYLGNQSLLLDTKHESYLLKHGFFDENVIALKIDSTDSYAFFVNETKYHNELNNIEDILKFLEDKYLRGNSPTDTLGSMKTDSINEKFSYEVISEKESYDIVFGSHVVYQIKFMTGLIGNVYKGNSSGKYFYLEYVSGKVYCKTFEDAAYKLFLSRNK